jgi:hypothetical protein
MTVPRINYQGGVPQPMGLRKACVKMALIEAETSRTQPLAKSDADMLQQIRTEVGPMQLTDAEAAMAAHIGVFYCSEYERLAGANDELVKVNAELEARLLEIARLAHTETDGG